LKLSDDEGFDKKNRDVGGEEAQERIFLKVF
jgi:hypothetical protein